MLRLHNISKYYKSNDVVALGLRRVSLEFNVGEFIAVTGESGSGKSTLLNVISGLDTYEDGEMYIAGEETSYFTVEEWENYRKQYIGFVFQNYNIIDSYTVLDNVLMALQIQGYDKTKRKERAMELIKKVGLESHMHHKAAKLSGGQKQRCVIARALAKDCPVIVADEPTGNLDRQTSETIIGLLKEISKEKLVIVVTHNYDEIKDHATRKIRLFDGEVIEDQVLRKTEKPEKDFKMIDYHMNHLELLKISMKNLLRTPRRTIFTVIIAIFIVAAFVFGFGAYKRDTTTTWSNWNQYFNNVTPGRIIVADFEGNPFDEAAIQNLNDIKNVRGVVLHDVVLDTTMYIYEKESEQSWYYEEEYVSKPQGDVGADGFMVYASNVYVNPATMVDELDLKEGYLPESKYQVLLEERSGYVVGDTVRMGFSHYWGMVDSLEDIHGINFEVVGIVEDGFNTNYEERAYFHDDFINDDTLLIRSYFRSGWDGSFMDLQVLKDGEVMMLDSYSEGGVIDLNNELNINEVEVSFRFIENLLEGIVEIDWDDVWQQTEECYDQASTEAEYIACEELRQTLAMQPYADYLEDNPTYLTGSDYKLVTTNVFYDKEININIIGLMDSTGYTSYNQPLMKMSFETARQLIGEEYYQVTVVVKGSFQAKSVRNELSALSLRNIYPNGIVSEEEQFFSIFNIIFLGITFGFFLFITYFIVYLVLRNVQLSKKKDYLVYRSIGASRRDLNYTTIYELVLSCLFGYVITMTFFVINENVKTKIPRLLQYLDFTNYLVSFLLLIFIAVMLGNRFNKKIFNRSVITALKQE